MLFLYKFPLLNWNVFALHYCLGYNNLLLDYFDKVFWRRGTIVDEKMTNEQCGSLIT